MSDAVPLPLPTGPSGGFLEGLSRARDGWEDRLRLEARVLGQMTVFESVAEMESLYRQFKVEMDSQDHLFFPERVAYLTELQARLAKQGRCQQQQRG